MNQPYSVQPNTKDGLHHTTGTKSWSRATLLTFLLVCAGCAEGVELVQETESGGVVTYPYKGDNGHLYSRLRDDAFQIIEKRCGKHYTIVREGEAKGSSRVSGVVEGMEEVITVRRWAIQFRCK